MAAARKFMFGRDFAEETARPHGRAQPEPTPETDPPPEPAAEPEPEPTYSADDLAAAQAQAHAEGHAAGVTAGRQAAEADAEQALTRALDRLAAGLETLAAGEAEAREARDRESLQLCVGLLRRLFPALARRHGQGEIEQVFQDALERLRDEPRVVVRCADRHLDGLKERVDGLAARLGFEGRIVLLADETMQPGDARVEWADGGVDRDSTRLWQDVERTLERALAAPPPASETRTRSAAGDTPAADTDTGAAPAPDAPGADTRGTDGHTAPDTDPDPTPAPPAGTRTTTTPSPMEDRHG